MSGNSFMPFSQNPANGITRKAGGGCLGCLWQSGVVLALGGVLALAITGLLFPWAFYLGGSFHILPYWQGWGTAHAKTGDYLLFVRIEPSTRGSRMYASSHLSGVSYVCTPRGENIRLRLGGGMRNHLKLSTDGEHISLYMNYWPWNANFTGDHRPSLELRGYWRNPNLVMDDDSSLGRAFQPDGTVYRGHDPNRPYMTEIVPVTLAPGSYSDFSAACAKARR